MKKYNTYKVVKKQGLKRQSKHQNQTSQDVAIIDREFKTAMINMLRAQMDNMDSMQDGQWKQRYGNLKKEPKRNTKDKKAL